MANFLYMLLVIVAVAAAAFSALVGPEATAGTKKILLVLWLIGPPVFFFLEYWFRRAALVASGDLERVKDMQRLAGQIWAGVAAALAVIYFKG